MNHSTGTHWPPRKSRIGNRKYCVRHDKHFTIEYDSGGKHRDLRSSSNPQWSASCGELGKSYKSKSYRTEWFVKAPITKKWVDRQWPIPNKTHERNCDIRLHHGGKIDTFCTSWTEI